MANEDWMADGILDFLIEAKAHTDRPGRVLASLASKVTGYDVAVGDFEYHLASRAVIALEDMGFVKVTRAYGRRKSKANVILRVELIEE